MRNNSNRRRFLQLAIGASLGTAAYSYYRGLRYTPITWEPATPDPQFLLNNVQVTGTDLIRTDASVAEDTAISLRAYAPEPKLEVSATEQSSLRLSVNNISPAAEMQILTGSPEQVSESTQGISRVLEIKLESTTGLAVAWKLPTLGSYKFAAIGDSGGRQELAWCIKRAQQLHAEFLLHLGDFNYQVGDYESAIGLFNNSPIPCYISIGNHDFEDYGVGYPLFLRDIGPLDHQFSIGKTRFANLDTSLHTLPYGGGQRGGLLQRLNAERESFVSTVAFTHRPLFDPMQEREHHFGSKGEQDWLINSLKQAQTQTLLSGHIHVQDQQLVSGINNYVAGQGLGHQDLITNSDYSKILLGEVETSGRVEFEFAPLSMPMDLHCHPRSDVVKQSLKASVHAEVIKQIDLACHQQS